jgi:large subunit ribosomal protein L25
MVDIILKAKQRKEETGKQLRSKNLIPAVVYGKEMDNIHLSLNQKTFKKAFEKAGTSSLIDLKIDKQKPLKVIIHEIQFDPVSDQLIHADFYRIKKDEKIRTEIPLNTTGKSPAVEEEAGNLIIDKDEIEVECLPDKLVDKIDVDISILKTFDDVIRISDLEIPDGIEVLEEKEEVVATTTPPRSEEELEELEETPTTSDVDEVEVEAEKEEEEEIEGEETQPEEEVGKDKEKEKDQN